MISTTQLLTVPFAQVAGKAPWTDYAVYNDTLLSIRQHTTAPYERPLNGTEIVKGSNISKSGPIITLKQGVYHITFSAYAAGVDNHQVVLRKLDNTSKSLIVGTTQVGIEHSSGTASIGESIIEVTDPNGIQVHLVHKILGGGSANYDFGATSSAGLETMNNCQIFIQKID